MHNLKIVSFLLFLLFSFEIYGQSNNNVEPKIIPPSPTAYELGRYGQADVGTFTGTPNISVPLYTYKTKNIAIPIALNYNSNGIQVDQMETNVGLGWSLSTGGIINRIVRGQPDERRNVLISEDMYCSDSFFTYIETNQLKDLQPDLYSYSFQGHSGQFVFDNNGKAVLVPQNNLKIEKLASNIKSGFKITTEDGIEYQFYDIEYSTWENVEAPKTVVTGWYLSKIIHPEGDVVNFTYKDTNYSFVSSISESFGIEMSRTNCGEPTLAAPLERMENHLIIMGKIIEGISSNESNFGNVSFQQIYNPNSIGNYLISGLKVLDREQNIIEKADFNYLFTANKRIFLNECIFKDTSKKYSFEYEAPDDLVARLSDQRDLWGYYNGKPGTYPDPVIHKDLYPDTNDVKNALRMRSTGDKRPDVEYAKKGILKKIVYPTKGYNEFEYEANTIWETVTSPLELETINQFYYSKNREQTQTFTFENKSDFETEIQSKVSYDDYELVDGTFPIGELWIMVTVENLTNPVLSLPPFTADEHNKPKKYTYKFIKDNTYKISIVFSPLPKTTGKVNFTYCKGAGIESKANVPVAGLRIKKIISFDNAQNQADVKHYYYGRKQTPHVSTGVEGIKPNLVSFAEIRRFCVPPGINFPWGQVDTTVFMNINPSSLYPLYKSTGNNSTTYENVTVSYGGNNFENGGEEFSYYVSADIPPYLCLASLLTSSPWVNISWDNGLIRTKKVFNKNLIDLNTVQYEYKLEDQYTQKVPGIAIDIRYNQLYHFTSPSYRNIEHLNISKYTTNSYWFYLESEKNTQYDLEGLNPVVTQTTYKYNNVLHQKLSSQTTTNSTEENIETKYFYASDPEMASEPFRNELVAKNIIGKVLDTQTLKQGVKLSEQKTVYDKSDKTSNLLLPGFIYANKGIEGINSSNDKKITFDQYDEKGNILQYTLESGIPVSIIWGYNKTQPIAKIDNLAYGSIPVGTIANLQALSNADTDNCMSGSCTEQLLRNGLNTFRASLPDAFISTYTYNPLVGVTSVTDPKGVASYYEYNSYGRLKFVKDKDLNVLQKYCYNYKGQQIDCNDNESTSVVLYRSAARSGSFTKNNCASGGAVTAVVYNQAEGVFSSTISQADADAKATDKFNTDGQTYANTNGYCTFYSAALSGSFNKSNCSVGGFGSSVPFTQAAGVSSSNISQAEADAQARVIFNANGKANANANGICTFYSIAVNATFTKNNCDAGGLGSNVKFGMISGICSSNVSQADADAKALIIFNANGQANANTYGNCTFRSAALSGSFTKSNCDAGGYGSSVPFSQVEGTASSNISQADADTQALIIFNTNGQAYANTYGDCTFMSAALSGSFQKNDCAVGGVGSSVNYSLAMGAVSLKTSQADADAQAWNKYQIEGQANANTYGNCTFYSGALSGSFTKSNCDTGGYGSSVSFSQVAGTSSSNSSQADADAQALNIFNANGQANANAAGYCTFYSPAMTGYFTKDNCDAGGAGSNVYYSQDFGGAYSHNSQAEANALGSNKFNAEGQAYANIYGDCTFMSAALSGSFQKNDCAVGGVGSSVNYSLAMGSVTLKTSQADADAQAWNKYQIEGQANANTYGNCTFYSGALSGSFTKSNCDTGGYGSSVSFSQVAGTVSSNSSQADADAQALNIFNANGQANANAAGYCTFYSPAMTGYFTKDNCDAGGAGSNVYYSQDFGGAYSHNSQAEANALGSNKFNAEGQAYANIYGDCTFMSAALSGSFQKNDCAVGGVGSSVNYSLAMGAVSLKTSQADADAQAWNKYQIEGQANANTYGNCTFYSGALSGSFTKSNCDTGGYGSSVSFSQVAGTVSSNSSQADADAQALNIFNANGQANANAAGYCTFYSPAMTGYFTKDNCDAGGAGSNVYYSQDFGGAYSHNSQAEANALGSNKFNADGQAYANANGICTFRNSTQSRLISRNNCTIGGIPDSVWYTVAAGAYASDISQAAADASAQLEINIYGQAYANANADCTFRSAAVSGSFQKNTCAGGAVGSFVEYALAEGAVVLKTSQAHVDSEALAKLNAEGQANANAGSQCLFYNVLIYRSIRRTYCPRGTNGTSVLYKVSPKTYSSLISQADANQKAEDEIDRLGQSYADKNGVCNQGEIEEK